MIDRNHPAVEALADAIYWALSGQYGDFGTPSKGEAHAALTTALPHLTADDLRNTPVGRELKAEGWDEGARDTDRVWEHAYDGHTVDPDSPYYECQTCNTTNPYLGETE